MKILIQDLESQLYLTHKGTWTANICAAKDFQSRPHAFDAIRLAHGSGLRVLYYFDELHYSIGARNRQENARARVCPVD